MTIHIFSNTPSFSDMEMETAWRRFIGEPDAVPLPRSHFASLIRDIRRDFYRLPAELRVKWRQLVREQINDVQRLAPRYFR